MKVISYNLKGNSCPIVIEQAGKKQLVKLRAGLSGEHALLCEWLGHLIGNSIGLNTRTPQWVKLTDTLDYKAIYIEVKDLINKSLGTNISFTYYEYVNELKLDELSPAEKEQFIDLYLLDVLMLNIDRTVQNHNILTIKEGKTLISDFDSCLIFNELLNHSKPSTNKRVLQCLKSHPFYLHSKNCDIKRFIEKINKVDFKGIVSKIPSELLSDDDKTTVLTNIENKKINHWNLRNTLHIIDEIILESKNERNIKAKENREKLEKRIRSTQ